MEVPRLGVDLELQLQAYTTAMATPDPSCICDLHSSLWQCWIPNPLSKARDQTCIVDTDTMSDSFFFFFWSFLGPHPRHMEIPRLGVKSEL